MSTITTPPATTTQATTTQAPQTATADAASPDGPAPDRRSRFMWERSLRQTAACQKLAAKYLDDPTRLAAGTTDRAQLTKRLTQAERLAESVERVTARAARCRAVYLQRGTVEAHEQLTDASLQLRSLLRSLHRFAGHQGSLAA